MIHYRALFRELLGEPAEGTGPADQDAVQDLAAAENEESRVQDEAQEESRVQDEAHEESRVQDEAQEESRVQDEAQEESRVQDEAQLDEAEVPVAVADGQTGDERAGIGDERADIPARRVPRS
jgi:hypothetical protein